MMIPLTILSILAQIASRQDELRLLVGAVQDLLETFAPDEPIELTQLGSTHADAAYTLHKYLKDLQQGEQ